jgi:hypothetical protein
VTEAATTSRALARRPRWLRAAALVAVLGGAIAGVVYERHASVWLRDAPPTPSCAVATRTYLRERVLLSGVEPHTALDGSTVYLNASEDRAVRCAYGESEELGRAFATAFAEIDPDPRAVALLAALRDHVPVDPAHDREAASAYLIASAALRALPASPAVTAASSAVRDLQACRFDVDAVCAARPPIPVVVWIAGAPAAACAAALLGVGLRASARRAAGAWGGSARAQAIRGDPRGSRPVYERGNSG